MCVFNFIFNWVFDSNIYWLDKHVIKAYVASFLMWWNVIKNVEGQKEILRHPLSISNENLKYWHGLRLYHEKSVTGQLQTNITDRETL